MTRYISLFSGIGGLELADGEPLLFCELDDACRKILASRHPDVPLHDDIETLDTPPKVEIVAGGWPCQDLSIAGRQTGMAGDRSRLFYSMLDIAVAAGARTIVGENVPNLIRINQGRDFEHLLSSVVAAGYPYVSWRVLNARAFGLPQERRRLFIAASKDREPALGLHAAIPELPSDSRVSDSIGFYWTAGRRSLCISRGFVPALKIGAADERGRAPVAVLRDGVVRKLTPQEFLRLQGFNDLPEYGYPSSTLLRMAGNAVPLAVGQFVMKAVSTEAPCAGVRVGFGTIADSGFLDDGVTWVMEHEQSRLAANLDDFIESDGDALSAQACAGLLVRAIRAKQPMPKELFDILLERSQVGPYKLRPSRANSFEALGALQPKLSNYRESLKPLEKYEHH